MKILKQFLLVTFLILIPVYAHSDNYTDDKKALATPYMKEKAQEKSGLMKSENVDKPQAGVPANAIDKTQVQDQIKAKSICIGEDCRNNWPVFKCVNYEGRPAGETGDEFCGRMNKTCMAVSIGGGQSFFDECSVPASSVHNCRCCWAQ